MTLYSGIIKEAVLELKTTFCCPLCQEMVVDPAFTGCGHIFCWHCLTELQHDNLFLSHCPSCKELSTKRRLENLAVWAEVISEVRHIVVACEQDIAGQTTCDPLPVNFDQLRVELPISQQTTILSSDVSSESELVTSQVKQNLQQEVEYMEQEIHHLRAELHNDCYSKLDGITDLRNNNSRVVSQLSFNMSDNEKAQIDFNPVGEINQLISNSGVRELAQSDCKEQLLLESRTSTEKTKVTRNLTGLVLDDFVISEQSKGSIVSEHVDDAALHQQQLKVISKADEYFPRKRHWLFVASGISPTTDQPFVDQLVKNVGCQFASKFTYGTTHVLVKPVVEGSRHCHRTLKYFQGIAHKAWILSIDWARDCVAMQQLLPPEKYEILGDTATNHNHYGPTNARLSGSLLLHHYEICCIGTFDDITRENLHDLVEACGGTNIFDPALFTPDLRQKHVIVVEASHKSTKRLQKLCRHHFSSVVAKEWLLDSIGTFNVKPLEPYFVVIKD